MGKSNATFNPRLDVEILLLEMLRTKENSFAP